MRSAAVASTANRLRWCPVLLGVGRGPACLATRSACAMDDRTFDQLTRRLAGGLGRRQLVGGLAALLGVAGRRATTSAAPAAKTTICHWDSLLGTYRQLSVTAKELKGHARHGQDLRTPDFT